MKKVLFIEGGGNTRKVSSALRKGFRSLLTRAGIESSQLQIVAGGGRNETYKLFCKALEGKRRNEAYFLLVDSETLVESVSSAPHSDFAWEHLQFRAPDKWKRPTGALAHQAQLMITSMETYFLADPKALQRFFGPKFRIKALPKPHHLEEKPTQVVLNALKSATTDCRGKRYHKGNHSFLLLEVIDPRQLSLHLPAFQRLLTSLQNK